MKYGLSEKQLTEIITFIQEYPEVEEAILFGSRAIDTYKEASDIDIALKGEKVTSSLAAKIKFNIEEDSYLPFFFDFIAYPTITNEELKHHINTKGIVIYGGMSEWREVTLGDAPIEILDGDRGKNYPKNHDFSDNGYCLFLNTKNVTSSGFCFNELNFITKEKDENLRKGKLERNDVVLTTRGTIGNVAFYGDNIKFENIRINSGMVIIRPLDIYPIFNLQLFKFLTLDLSEFTSGSAQPQLPIRDLKQILVSLPTLPEQKAIAEVLSSLDDKIDLLHRQNKTLEQMSETLFRQWFVEEAGEDWDEKPLSEFLDFREGPGIRNWQYVEDSGVNFINIRLINNNDIDITKANQISKDEAFGKYAHFLLEEKDMVVSTSGTLGKSAIIRKHHLPLCLNTSVIRFRPADKLNYSFMYQYLKSPIFIEQLETMASGSVQLNFGPTHLKRIFLQNPPNKNLTKYRLQADGIYEKIEYNQTQVRTLEFLRDTLLPKLMSGEVRIASHG